MPNVKLYVDDAVLSDKADAADALLVAIRGFLCDALGVTQDACHIVILGVRPLAGQTPANLELVLLRRQDRTRDLMASICARLRDLVADRMGCNAAVRCAMMEAEHYIVAR